MSHELAREVTNVCCFGDHIRFEFRRKKTSKTNVRLGELTWDEISAILFRYKIE